MKAEKFLSFETARTFLRVDFETGKLFWNPRPVSFFVNSRSFRSWNTQFANTEAFTADKGNGYLIGTIRQRNYLAHRVVWLLATGAWPDHQIDHINGVRSDNRFSNLREVLPGENNQNQSRPKDNKSGVVGVVWYKQTEKWAAKIGVGNTDVHLGYFLHFSDAVAARKAAEEKYGFHPNHGRTA